MQGAAAEFFKTWAALVRARGAAVDARIVLCLHDELVVHVPDEHSAETVDVLDTCLTEAAVRWSPPGVERVRFVADISVVKRWSDIK